jgi:sulfite exporter TauE/SafE
MAAFGLATLPIMLTMSALAQGVARFMARVWVRRTAGAVVLAFGLWSTAGVASQAGVAGALGVGGAHHCCPKR